MKAIFSRILPALLALALMLLTWGCAPEAPVPPASSLPQESVPEEPSSEVPTEAPVPSSELPSSPSQEAGATGSPFPFYLEDGKLAVESLFQFTGFNPDAGGAQATDTGALQVKNLSGEHLESALFTLPVPEGELTFRVTDLPPGACAMIFSLENAPIAPGTSPEGLTCEAVFLPEPPLMEDSLSFTVEDMTVSVTNHSGTDLNQVNIYCHSILDDVCFGGLTYCYTIEMLPAGETACVEALDCYLGGAMVVRIGTDQ